MKLVVRSTTCFNETPENEMKMGKVRPDCDYHTRGNKLKVSVCEMGLKVGFKLF